MKWLHRFKKSCGIAKHADGNLPPAPDSNILSAVLVHQFCHEHFGLGRDGLEECVSVVPTNLRALAKDWTLYYLTWFFRLKATSRFGTEYSEPMLLNAKDLLMKVCTDHPELVGVERDLEFWLRALDRSTSNLGTKVHDVEIPFPVWAAISFMVLDKNSPYFQLDRTNREEFIVGEAFAEAAKRADPWMTACLDASQAIQG